jgi:glycerol kinase
MEDESGIKLTSLKVDGGAATNNFLMQFQADILGMEVKRPESIETTSLGAAYLAGLAVGYWKDEEDILENWQLGKNFIPKMEKNEREKLVNGWQRAVKCALEWAKEVT